MKLLLINNKTTTWMNTMIYYPPIMKISKINMNRTLEMKESSRKTTRNRKMTILMETKILRMK